MLTIFLVFCITIICLLIPKWYLIARTYIFVFVKKRKEYIKQNNGKKPTIIEMHNTVIDSRDYYLSDYLVICDVPVISFFVSCFDLIYVLIRLFLWLIYVFFKTINHKNWSGKTLKYVYNLCSKVFLKIFNYLYELSYRFNDFVEVQFNKFLSKIGDKRI